VNGDLVKQELTFQSKFFARMFGGRVTMSESSDEAKTGKPPKQQENRKDKRILIVEDDRLSMTLLSDFLNAHGYRVLKTSQGLDAINLARDEQPDLILMDIKLPDISGFDVTRLLKRDKQTKAIPIIAVTAFATSGDEIKALESGCDAYIPKPISFDKLLRTIQSFLPSSFP
jgi:two-component system, cell cycle response regulator DivK